MRPLAPRLAVLAVGLTLVTVPGQISPAQADSTSSSAARAEQGDPNARPVNKLIRAVNDDERRSARRFATRDVVASMFEYREIGAVFGRARRCEATGPLRPALQRQVRMINCRSVIRDNLGEKVGTVTLSYDDRGDRTVFRAFYDIPPQGGMLR